MQQAALATLFPGVEDLGPNRLQGLAEEPLVRPFESTLLLPGQAPMSAASRWPTPSCRKQALLQGSQIQDRAAHRRAVWGAWRHGEEQAGLAADQGGAADAGAVQQSRHRACQ